jgi:hypothetical protein
MKGVCKVEELGEGRIAQRRGGTMGENGRPSGVAQTMLYEAWSKRELG